MRADRTGTHSEHTAREKGRYKQIQLIDFDGNFQTGFDEHLRSLNLLTRGFSYNVVTVLGCQSSGKSTLLNSLFDTSFPEMNAMQGRSQTTKGIWIARDSLSPTLIVDVEGTDSKERGEDRLTFEHRASLFSLAIADAVLINMWYQDLGRYSASNYGLLKTVLAVNLELFGQDLDAKTTMIFVIRDWSSAVTPLSVLEGMLLTDLDEIWSEIKKPANCKSARLGDYFRFLVIGMPSKVQEPDKYEARVLELRDQWLKEEAPTEYSRKVPADGFAIYAQQVWQTILTSSELNIPSQKEMVATYRCEEIRSAVLVSILPMIHAHIDQPTKLFDEKVAEEAIVQALELYHKDAWRYQENIYEVKKEELLQSLYVEIQKPLETFMFATRQKLLRAGIAALDRECRKDDWDESKMHDGCSCLEFWSSFPNVTQQWKLGILQDFDSICGHAAIDCVVELSSSPDKKREHVVHVFDMSMIRQTLEESLDEAIEASKHHEMQAFIRFVGERADAYRAEIETLYGARDLKHVAFWNSVSQILAEKADILEVELGGTIEGLMQGNGGDEVSMRDRLAIILMKCLRERMIGRLDLLSDLIHRRFCTFFEADEKGVPYYWAGMSQDRIRNIYVDAKDQADALLPVLSTFDVRLELIISSVEACSLSDLKILQMPIMTDAKRAEIAALAAKRMLKSCQEAQFIQATGGKVGSPAWWWWGLLLLLGWNELMAVLRSPIFFTMAMAAVLLLTVTFYTGNAAALVNAGRSLMSLGLSVLIPMLTHFQSPSNSAAFAHALRAAPDDTSPDTECRNTPTTTAN